MPPPDSTQPARPAPTCPPLAAGPRSSPAPARIGLDRLAGVGLLLAALGSPLVRVALPVQVAALFAGTAGLCLLALGARRCRDACRLTWRRRPIEHRATLERGCPVAFFRAAAVFALVVGFATTLVALIVILRNLDDPAVLGGLIAYGLHALLWTAAVATACLLIAIWHGGDRALRGVMPLAFAAFVVGAMALAGLLAPLLPWAS